MVSHQRTTESGLKYVSKGSGAYAVVFVHGFLDAAPVWDDVVARLSGIECVQLDLAGMGERKNEGGPFSLDRFATDVGAVVDAIGKPFVIVGQSMGAQVAELVAAQRPDRAAGLVLQTPVPLRGVGLSTDGLAPFHALGGNREAQIAVRRQLTVGQAADKLQRLAEQGFEVRSDVVTTLVDTWNAGHPDGADPSRYQGAVLVVNGVDDGFVTSDLIAKVIARFPEATTASVAKAGHWPHAEQPAAVFALLSGFIGSVNWAATSGNTVANVKPQGWTNAFAQKSADTFADAFDDYVVLEASVLMRPVEGITQVKTVMSTASKIYEALAFTHEAVNGQRNYLEWQAQAFGGMKLRGITVLTKNDAGKIIRVAIHHRPLAAALRFSAELRERLHGQIDSDHFYTAA